MMSKGISFVMYIVRLILYKIVYAYSLFKILVLGFEW